ncbi:hypothetical protein Tco_0742980 [Tanacetum coccineum]
MSHFVISTTSTTWLLTYKSPKEVKGFHQIVDFLNTCHIKYALIENPTIYVSLIEQFWQTAFASTLENGDMEITATIDEKVKGRKIAQIDKDEGITLVQMCAQTQGRQEYDLELDFEFIAPEENYTAEPDISTANVPVSIAGPEVSTASPEVRTVAESLVYIIRSAAKRKDKGKSIMKKAKLVQKKTKLQLKQEILGLEEALRLQEQLDKEEMQRIARVQKEASTFNTEEWDNIQAQIEAEMSITQATSTRKRILEEGMNVEALQTKYPIIDWEVYTKDSRKYWKIIRVGDHTEVYQFFKDMLKNFNRDDHSEIGDLVRERVQFTRTY